MHVYLQGDTAGGTQWPRSAALEYWNKQVYKYYYLVILPAWSVECKSIGELVFCLAIEIAARDEIVTIA